MKTQFLMLLSFLIIVLVVFIYSVINRHKLKKTKNTFIGDIELYQKNISYPYKASKDRQQTILNNINRLKKGMNKQDVIAIMTNPDEANLTYKYIKVKTGNESENITGFSLLYLLRKDVEDGSINEKNEQLIRIFFDKSEHLIYTVSNINGFDNIDKEP